eukprot:g26189.t2
MESLKPLAPQPAVGSQAPCEAGARPYGMVNGVNGVNGKSRSPERVDALERHRSRQEVEDRRLGRSEALLDVESPPTQDTTVASTAPCSISRRVMCGMAWTLFSVCLLGWAVIFFMPTTETGRSDEVMELAQFKPETADDVEAEKAQFGQMASKAAELAKLLRVLRGKEQALNPVNGRSRSPEHSVQESLRPSASSESDPVRLEEQRCLELRTAVELAKADQCSEGAQAMAAWLSFLATSGGYDFSA